MFCLGFNWLIVGVNIKKPLQSPTTINNSNISENCSPAPGPSSRCIKWTITEKFAIKK